MQVFPAIDLMDGAAVRLEQGRRESVKVYDRAPWEVAARFAAAGVSRIHVVDLDAAFTRGAPVDAREDNRATIARIAAAAKVEVEAGGGVRSLDDCAALFDAGVRLAVLGTAAIKDPALVETACTRWPGRIVIAVDAREGKVSVEGWTETTGADALEIGAAVARAGAAAVLYTDIARDGMLQGLNLDATVALADTISIPVIASGGLASIEDIKALLEPRAKILAGAIAGRALYDGRLDAAEALKLIRAARTAA